MNTEKDPWQSAKKASSGWDELTTLHQNYEAEPTTPEIIDMTKAGEGELRENFRSGVYLFHSARVEQIESILESGALMNSGEIYERLLEKKRAELEAAGESEEKIEAELKTVYFARNSGQEGISWSANGIDAMPGTDGQIAGFLAAPEDILSGEKLVIPSRPAPYELLQVSDEVETKKFFEAKMEYEVWGYRDIGIGERASVDNGLMMLFLAAKHEKERGDKEELNFYSSKLLDFANRGGLPPEELRKYKVRGGEISVNPALHQQKFDEHYIPPAAVYMQALIDRGTFNQTPCEGMDVNQLVKYSMGNEKLPLYMLSLAREQGKKYLERYEKELDKAHGVVIPIEKMYFVTSHSDLDGWQKTMQKFGRTPKGFLLYDDEKVVKQNFASQEPGDHKELAAELGRVVGADGAFWGQRVGLDIENMPRTGHMGQVLDYSAINTGVEIKLDDSGELVVNHISE